MIEVRNLSVHYQEATALEDINLTIREGEYVLITGPSGCGKSTLARAVSGMLPHAIQARMEGSVRVAGLDTISNPLPVLAQNVGLVFQNPGSQLFHLRVDDEVAFGPRNLGLDEAEVKARTDWALEAVNLTHLRDRRPDELSGGQKQCLAIAALLSMRPKVLVLDEPTASLDLPNTYKVLETLSGLRDHYGITILIIEHRLAAALQGVDRVLLMDEGKIIADGSPEEIFADRKRRESLGLRRPAEQPMTPWKDLIQPNGKSRLEEVALIRLDGVSAGYNRRDVIHEIDLDIYPGDFMAVVGANGVGKSTLALVISGLLKPRQGKVRHAGNHRFKPGLDVALLFQDAADQLFCDTVDSEVAFAPQNFHCFDPDLHQRALQEADLLGLETRRPSSLSVGQQQRTALAACLAVQPRLVILDEPTLGQDWGHLQRLIDYLSHLNQRGTAILLITHDYKLVHHYAQRIVLLENGRIKMNGYLQNEISKGDEK